MSSTPSTRLTTGAAASWARQADDFQSRLSALYALSQENRHLFGSPLGPFSRQGRDAYVPRFVFFGPHAADDSWRLAFLAGHDHRDLRASRAVLHLVEHLARNSERGHGLNLSFFPLMDAAGFYHGVPPRALGAEHWGRSVAPEINLLGQDARQRGYHGFIRVESATHDADIVTIQVRPSGRRAASPDLELISSEETDPFPVRFECLPAEAVPVGPLSIAADLPVQPFELVLRVPAAWPDEIYHEAVSFILSRFILRYRAFQAYGLHL